MTSCDLLSFALLCESLSDYIALRSLVKFSGQFVDGKSARALDESRKSVLGLAKECGQTVTSRIGMVLSKAPKKAKPAGEISLFAKG